MTFLAGNAAYVFHAGPGIRGGGAADVSSKLRRHAHFDELPTFTSIAAALTAAKQYLPPGLANWTRHEPNSADAPIDGYGSLYTASAGSNFVALAVGNAEPITVRVKTDTSIDVRQTATGKLVTHLNGLSGQSMTLHSAEPLVLIGSRKSH